MWWLGMPWDDTPLEHHDNPVDNPPFGQRIRWATMRSLTPDERAEMLLRQHLVPAQQDDWDRNRMFNVRGADRKLYRIGAGYTQYCRHRAFGFWAREIDDYDYHVRRPRRPEPIPAADRVLALKLLVESDTGPMYRFCHGDGWSPRDGRDRLHDYGGVI